MMIFYRHVPIIPHHIDTILFDSSRREIPVTRVTDIRFLQFLAVNQKSSLAKFNLLPLEGDHTFQKHHSAPCQANRHDIKPSRLREEIRQPPAEIHPPVVIGWLHTDSLNAEWNAEMTEKEIGEEPNQEDPDQELPC